MAKNWRKSSVFLLLQNEDVHKVEEAVTLALEFAKWWTSQKTIFEIVLFFKSKTDDVSVIRMAFDIWLEAVYEDQGYADKRPEIRSY